MSMTWPEATSWTIRGVGTLVTLEAGGALLVAGAAGVAFAQPVPVSREMAERIGTAERAERAKLLEAAHGGPVALPTPSPFLNEQYVRTLPTQAQLDAHPQLAPHAVPGSAPSLPGNETALEASVYPNVNSHALAAGVKALGDTGRCFPKFESFEGNSRQAFDKLKDLMQPPDGWETHHFVEQNRTEQFGTQAIQNRANAINLPKPVHTEVSARFSRGPVEGTPAEKFATAHPELKISSLRDYVRTLSFAEQRQFSVDTIRTVLEDPKFHVSAQDRATIEKDLQRLENPTLDKNLCPPLSQAPGRATPEIADVQIAIDGLRDQGVRLVSAQSVQPWNGKTQVGSFVDLGDGMVAQHIGRGNYSFMDVQQDLGGVQPPIGQFVTLAPNGQAQVPQIEPPSLGRG